MAAKVQQGFDHLQVALVDSYVQWRLSALIPGIQVSTASLQHLNDRALIAKGCMVHRPVSIFVLSIETFTHDDSMLKVGLDFPKTV